MLDNETEYYSTLFDATKPMRESIRPHREVIRNEPTMPKEGSQCWRILKKFVENSGIIFTGDLMRMYIARYGARIGDLRHKYGWNIQTSKVKQGKMQYTLEEDQYYNLYMKKFEIFGDDLNYN
jgi:hypothetical protein|tara:strand:+ start:335 stop:703 length:369 start_codon:yes stop_codon:yes gene_type:complete